MDQNKKPKTLFKFNKEIILPLTKLVNIKLHIY